MGRFFNTHDKGRKLGISPSAASSEFVNSDVQHSPQPLLYRQQVIENKAPLSKYELEIQRCPFEVMCCNHSASQNMPMIDSAAV